MSILDRNYRHEYTGVFHDILKDGPPGRYDETALPSYTNANSLISWIFWRRIETALALAGPLEGRTVLDFGCGGCVTFRYLAEHGAAIAGYEPLHAGLSRTVCSLLSLEVEIHGESDFIR